MFNNHPLISPQELPTAYASGKIVGVYADHTDFPSHLRRAARYAKDEAKSDLGDLRFATANKDSRIVGSGKGKRAFLWREYLAVDLAKALWGAQLTGDCVSWSKRTAIDITRVWEFRVLKQLEQYLLRQATAMLYASRGHTNQGASPTRVAAAAVKDGILLEQEITDADGKVWDFRDYRTYVKIGMQMGRTGLPESLKQITRKNRVQRTAVVESLDELADAMYSGYCGSCGSSMGVSSSGNPISRRSGSWAHDMAIVGYDDSREFFNERVWIWDQSWGEWNKLTNLPEAYKPWGQGMFILNDADTWFAVRQGETSIFSDTLGFEFRPFDNRPF